MFTARRSGRRRARTALLLLRRLIFAALVFLFLHTLINVYSWVPVQSPRDGTEDGFITLPQGGAPDNEAPTSEKVSEPIIRSNTRSLAGTPSLDGAALRDSLLQSWPADKPKVRS